MIGYSCSGEHEKARGIYIINLDVDCRAERPEMWTLPTAEHKVSSCPRLMLPVHAGKTYRPPLSRKRGALLHSHIRSLFSSVLDCGVHTLASHSSVVDPGQIQDAAYAALQAAHAVSEYHVHSSQAAGFHPGTCLLPHSRAPPLPSSALPIRSLVLVGMLEELATPSQGHNVWGACRRSHCTHNARGPSAALVKQGQPRTSSPVQANRVPRPACQSCPSTPLSAGASTPVKRTGMHRQAAQVLGQSWRSN